MKRVIQQLAIKHSQFETSLGELDVKQYVFTVDQLMRFIAEYIDTDFPLKDVDRVSWIEEMVKRYDDGITFKAVRNSENKYVGCKIIADDENVKTYETLRTAINENMGLL